MTPNQKAIIALTMICNLCGQIITDPLKFPKGFRHCKYCGRAVCVICAPIPSYIHPISETGALSVPDTCGYECRVCLYHPQGKEFREKVKNYCVFLFIS